jgi:hypothetical protein
VACSAGATQNCLVDYPVCPESGCNGECWHTGSQRCADDCSGWGACTPTGGGWLC